MNKLKKPLVIVANGEFPSHSVPLKILINANCVLACDGAADTLLNEGYAPDVILGDLDSLSDDTKEKYKGIVIEMQDQSQNDLRKALNYAREQNISDISIIGSSGKREDHTLGNIFSILDYKDSNIKLYTNTGVFTCIHKSQKIESFKGQQVSIFTADPTMKITSKNLKYRFNNTAISAIYSGTLNESTLGEFELLISHGSLLIFQTYK